MKRILSRSPGVAGLATAALVAATAVPAWADLETGSLPGGTSIDVSIDTPADGTILPPGPVTITGTAAVGMGEPDTALIYVVDVSGSTDDVTTDCPDPGDDILDCEKAAAIELNQQALTTTGEVGAVFFGTTAQAADLDQAAGAQLVTEPDADSDNDGVHDVEQVLSSAVLVTDQTPFLGQFDDFSGTQSVEAGTSYGGAILGATEAAAASSMERQVVAFFSDGQNELGPDIGDAETPGTPLGDVPPEVDFFTFALGGFMCSDDLGFGSLQDIAVETDGACQEVEDVADLPGDLLEAFASELNTLTLQVDDGPDMEITDVTPMLPREGPDNVVYTVTTEPLTAGTHELCVTAGGSDVGGQDDDAVTDCHTVIINAPPEVDAGGPYAGQEGSPVSIAGTVTDPDSEPAIEWTIAPSGDVDAGTTCAFGDATAESTTVTCTDDGTFTLTLTADDGVNPPVTDTATVELANVAPSVSISAPDDGELFAADTPVEFVAPFTDPGSNDTHTCTVDFDDGTPVADGTVDQSPGSGTCTITHSFTELGPHNVLVTVTDDNGGSATAVVTVVTFLPGEAFAIEANGLLTIPKTPHATCPPDESLTQAQLNVPGLATANALNADCTVDAESGETIASASVDEASLLGGLITITNIESTCQSNADGITRTSSVGTINGTEIGVGSGSITIPLVASVFFNETTTVDGRLAQNAIRVQTLLGQEIILAGCRLG